MQFATEKKKLEWKSKQLVSGLSHRKGRPKVKVGDDDSLYKMEVNFYALPPLGDISLEDAESSVDERLKLLLVFEDIKTSSSMTNFDEYLSYVGNKLDNIVKGNNFLKAESELLKKNNEATIAYRRRDHISHFLLRIYFCRTEELRKKFITLESEFLRFRLLSLGKKDAQQIVEFIKQYHFNFEPVEKEKEQLTHEKKLDFMYTPDLTLFKLPFEEALDVVSRRRAYLHDGYAYICSSDMISIIVYKFQLELAQSLASLSVRLSELDEERRLIPVIDNVYKLSLKNKRVMDATSRSTGFSVTPDMLDDLSKQSFPPCMQHIHETLRKNHHLKHYGRLHYGLFLKNIGLSLEDALNFFREEFIQKVTPERFQRDYAYNIRYNYGKEGKKVNLSAYSCAKIINGCAPQPGDTHGCPFRHFDTENLRNLLKRSGVDDNEVDEITAIAGEKNYTKACSKYFEVKHKQLLQNDEFIYHPNQFYRESRRVMVSGREQVCDTQEISCENEDDVSMVATESDSHAPLEYQPEIENVGE